VKLEGSSDSDSSLSVAENASFRPLRRDGVIQPTPSLALVYRVGEPRFGGNWGSSSGYGLAVVFAIIRYLLVSIDK